MGFDFTKLVITKSKSKILLGSKTQSSNKGCIVPFVPDEPEPKPTPTEDNLVGKTFYQNRNYGPFTPGPTPFLTFTETTISETSMIEGFPAGGRTITLNDTATNNYRYNADKTQVIYTVDGEDKIFVTYVSSTKTLTYGSATYDYYNPDHSNLGTHDIEITSWINEIDKPIYGEAYLTDGVLIVKITNSDDTNYVLVPHKTDMYNAKALLDVNDNVNTNYYFNYINDNITIFKGSTALSPGRYKIAFDLVNRTNNNDRINNYIVQEFAVLLPSDCTLVGSNAIIGDGSTARIVATIGNEMMDSCSVYCSINVPDTTNYITLGQNRMKGGQTIEDTFSTSDITAPEITTDSYGIKSVKYPVRLHHLVGINTDNEELNKDYLVPNDYITIEKWNNIGGSLGGSGYLYAIKCGNVRMPVQLINN